MIKEKIEKTLTNAEKLNGELNSFLSIEREFATKRAEEVENNPSENALNGVAIAIKDNICTKDLQTTCGSRILHNYKAHYDATAVKKLTEAGAIIAVSYTHLTLPTKA
jgi:aspartyl-tRNA(Asn)/glutamyl-tRNA(Gln) amidotransferase subunit A